MTVRKPRRIEVRIDQERHRFLEEEVARRGTTVAAWVREKIDDDREQLRQREREAAVERLLALELDIPADPRELKRLLEEACCPGPEFCDCRESL